MRLQRVLLLLPVMLLMLLGLGAIGGAHRLQAEIGRAQLSRAAQTLSTALAAPYDQEGLRGAARTFFQLAANQQGLRRLRLSDRDGGTLLTLGAYDSWQWSGPLARLFENLLYRYSNSQGTAAVYGPEQRYLGRADFDFIPGMIDSAQAHAVAQLRWTGYAFLLLGLVTLPLYWWLLPLLRGAPSWVQRADPQPQASARPPDLLSMLGLFRERAGAMLDSVHYALVTADGDGRINHLNVTAEKLCGWALAAARKRMIYSVFHTVNENDAPLQTALETALQKGIDVPLQRGWLRARDGRRQPIEMMASLMRGNDGMVIGAAMMLRDVSTHLAEVDDLKREARLSQAIVDHLEEGVLITDPAGVVRFANSRAESQFGYSRAELQGFTVTKLMPVPFLNTPGLRITDYVMTPGSSDRGQHQLPSIVGWRKDATTFPIELWVQQLRTEQGESLVLMVRDISERLRGEKIAMRLGRLLDAAVEEVYIFEAQSLLLLEVNRSARRNLGFHPEVIARMTLLDLAEDLDEGVFRSYLQQLGSGSRESVVFRCRNRRADGSSYPVEVRLNYSRDEEPAVFMAIAIDISERLAAEERLRHLAHHDALTGLPNRVMLLDRLEQAWLGTQRGDRMLGVLVLDLDQLREVNERLGHEIGDRLLKAAAERLQATLRPSDTVARVGEDEFVVLAPGLRSVEDAQLVAQKLLDAFVQPFAVDEQQLDVRCSIGVNVYPVDEAGPEGLLLHAGQALREAKQSGGGRQCAYLAQIDVPRQRQLDLQREVSAALALDELSLQFRPALHEGTVRALFARLVWRHARLGEVGHGELMRLAQRAGIAGQLELLQLHRAATFCAGLREAGLQLPDVIIEVSGWQLRSGDFARQSAELLQRYAMPPQRLLLALDGEGIKALQHRHPRVAELLASGVRLAFADACPPLPPPIEMPVQLLLTGRACQSVDQITALSAAARRRELNLIATQLDDTQVLSRWRGSAVAVAGDAVQKALPYEEALDWLRQRPIEPL